ncbi:transketolase [Pseudonocardiaceae bacterium YIM PH 21723]|nr:transketolase [Pseudonocardiaceae bacterium YIM PH 21723]
MDMRDTFLTDISAAIDTDPRIALVLADISAVAVEDVALRHPDQVINVGIREQTLIGVAGGLALTGLRPVAHSYAPFLIERPFEQVKLDFGHQDTGAVLVSIGGSHEWTEGGRTHMSPGDVALLDTLPGWTVHVPGHAAEVRELLADALLRDDRIYLRLNIRANRVPHLGSGFQTIRQGTAGVVLAVGPMLDSVLEATAGRDLTVLYASTIRPFDGVRLRSAVWDARPDVAVVEPYLRGTSSHFVNDALADVPHRVLSLGIRRDTEIRRYGTPEQHDTAHGIDPDGLRTAFDGFFSVN